MNQKLKTILAVIGAVAVIAVLALVFVIEKPAKDTQAFSVTLRQDPILGSGTTTAGTYNFGAAATTSAGVFQPPKGTDVIDFDVYPESASSSAHVGFQILKSSLPRCAATSGDLQYWVDANKRESVSAHLVSLNNGTTTVEAVPQAQTGFSFRVSNWNADCMKVFIGGQSVNLYVQANYRALYDGK